MARLARARWVFWMVTAGAALQLLGLAVDGILHAADAGLQDEALLSLNPGHLLIGAGMALTATGAALWATRLLRVRRAPSSVAALPVVGFAALGIVAVVFAARADGHDHAEDVMHGHEATAIDEPVAAADAHGHGRSGASISLIELQTLNRQLDESRATAERYRDIRTAVADGYIQVTQDLPGIAAHFIRLDLLMDGKFDPSRPEMLLYTFRGGAWRFAGISHALPYTGDDTPPEGFAGPLDGWHYHDNLCAAAGAIIGIRASEESCAARGGNFIQRTFWMNHVWVGGTGPVADLFSEANPLLLVGASWRLYKPGDPVAS